MLKGRRALGRVKALTLISLPGFPRAEIFEIRPFLGEASDGGNWCPWQSLLAWCRVPHGQVWILSQLFVTHTESSAVGKGGTLLLWTPLIIKITIIMCFIELGSEQLTLSASSHFRENEKEGEREKRKEEIKGKLRFMRICTRQAGEPISPGQSGSFVRATELHP